MGFEGNQESINPAQKTIVYDSLILESVNLMSTPESIFVNLILLRSNERFFVDIRMDFDIRVITQLKSVLICLSQG